MSYPIIELEITEAIPTLRTADSDTGIALILRFKDKPIGFYMKPLPAKSVLSPEELAPMLSRVIGTKLLQEKIREELVPPTSRVQFPSLTVAICTKDRPENLLRCLQHLLKLQRAEDSPPFEVLVVDNSPSDERTKVLVATLPGVRYLQEPKAGLNFARNRAIRETDCELLAYIDDDVVVDHGWLSGLHEAWSENPDAAAFTGQVLPMELVTEAQILFERRGGFRRGFEKVRYTSTLSGDDGYLYPCQTGIFGVGCNMAFRRQTLLAIGGFDEALDTGAPLPGGGDHDIFYQVIRAGYPLVYEPTYLVFHQHRRTMKQLSHQYWTWGLSVMAFASKAHRMDLPLRSRWRKLMVGWFREHLKELTMATFGRHTLPTIIVFQELWGGILGLCGEYERSKQRVQQIRRQHQ